MGASHSAPKLEHRVVDVNPSRGRGRAPGVGTSVGTSGAAEKFPSNRVTSTKYVWYSFLPQNVFEQLLSKHINRYFLFIACLQLWPSVAPVNPLTIWVPLVIVFLITSIREGADDLQRWYQDKLVNNLKYQVVGRDGCHRSVLSKDILVGDIVRVDDGGDVPCDIVVVKAANENGRFQAFTANLDGESDLKEHVALDLTQVLTVHELGTLAAVIECDHPNAHLHSFNGRLIYNRVVHPVNLRQTLFQGMQMRGCPCVYGVAVYTGGKQTKIGMNKQKAHVKKTKLDTAIDAGAIVLLGLQLCFTFSLGLAGYVWMNSRGDTAWYLDYQNKHHWLDLVVNPVRWLLITSYMVPISLKVTVDVVKVFHSKFIEWDLNLYDEKRDIAAKVYSSEITEDLGQVKFLVTDKTGTLTDNSLIFRGCSIGARTFSSLDADQGGGAAPGSGRWGSLHSSIDGGDEHIGLFFRVLALCHSAQRTAASKDEEFRYTSGSPDEECLVQAAAEFGFAFWTRNEKTVFIQVRGVTEEYEILHVLEFSSDRKRMSVVVKDVQKDKIYLMCKGADDIVLALCRPDQTKNVTVNYLRGFAHQGLRTLCVAYKEVGPEYVQWAERYAAAAVALECRDESIAGAFVELEDGMCILGSTAIEDCLQDGVPETVENLRRAGIRIWILTGDKYETAVQIGISSRLLCSDSSTQLLVTGSSSQDLLACLEHHLNLVTNDSGEYSILVDGDTLQRAIEHHKETFKQLGVRAASVVCFRATPAQKARVARMLRPEGTTVCIGDGGNDVAMILEADVGIGLAGKEGLQAARSADISCTRFRHLQRLLLVHGRYSYHRTAFIAQFVFYKSCLIALMQVYYSAGSAFSGVSLFDSLQLFGYTTTYTSLPVMFFLLDKDIQEQLALTQPELYKPNQRGVRFNWTTFTSWIVKAFYQSGLIALVTFVGLNPHFQATLDASPLDMSGLSFVVFTCLLVVQTLTMFVKSNTITAWNSGVIFGSLGIYFILQVITSAVPKFASFFVFFRLLLDPAVYLNVLLVAVAGVLPVFAWKHHCEVKSGKDSGTMGVPLLSLSDTDSLDVMRV